MITGAHTTAATLTEHVPSGSERLVDETERLTRQVAGRRLVCSVVVSPVLTADEVLAPSGVVPLPAAGDVGPVVYGHVDEPVDAADPHAVTVTEVR